MSGGAEVVWRGRDPALATAISARLREEGIEAEILTESDVVVGGLWFEVVVPAGEAGRAVEVVRGMMVERGEV